MTDTDKNLITESKDLITQRIDSLSFANLNVESAARKDKVCTRHINQIWKGLNITQGASISQQYDAAVWAQKTADLGRSTSEIPALPALIQQLIRPGNRGYPQPAVFSAGIWALAQCRHFSYNALTNCYKCAHPKHVYPTPATIRVVEYALFERGPLTVLAPPKVDLSTSKMMLPAAQPPIKTAPKPDPLLLFGPVESPKPPKPPEAAQKIDTRTRVRVYVDLFNARRMDVVSFEQAILDLIEDAA